MTPRPLRSRRTTVGLAAILLLWPLTASVAFASTHTVSGSDRAAAVQAVLDRVLGPGNSTVVVSETVQTSSSQKASVRWTSGAIGSIEQNEVVTPAGTSLTTTQQNLDGSTTTVTATPAGSLVDRSVSVVVDRAHLGSTSLASVRRLAAATAGLVPSRGDRVSVIAATFARPAPVAVPGAAPLSLLLPFAVPAIWVLGGLIALAIVLVTVRPAKPATDLRRP